MVIDQKKVFELPEDNFTAGSTRNFTVNTFSGLGAPFDLTGATVTFSLVDYINLGAPVLTKPASLIRSNGGNCGATAKLEPADTVSLFGKYIYQFSIVDIGGDAYIARGLVVINRNTLPTAITE